MLIFKSGGPVTKIQVDNYLTFLVFGMLDIKSHLATMAVDNQSKKTLHNQQ